MTTTLKESPGLTALALLLPGLLLGLFAGCISNRPTTTALQSLQGTWKGFMLERDTPTGPYVKPKDANEITITIKGNSLNFYVDEDFWWDATFTLLTDAFPQQLHATIQRPEDHSGEGVVAFFKIEGETLTLGGIRSRDSEAEWPKSFEATVDTMAGRYELRRAEYLTHRAPSGNL